MAISETTHVSQGVLVQEGLMLEKERDAIRWWIFVQHQHLD
jgi:hypothetical protein